MDAFDYEGEEEGSSSDVAGDWKSLQPARSLPSQADVRRLTRERAAQVYDEYATLYKRRFKWLRPDLFSAHLKRDLAADARALLDVMQRCECSDWDPASDAKLNALHRLLTVDHPHDKVLVFTQFADTVRYLETQLRGAGCGPTGGRHRRLAGPHRRRLAFQPGEQRKARPGALRRRAAGAGRHRRPERRPEPAGRLDRRQLRPAVGHHPA